MHYHIDDSGKTIYAFPTNQLLSTWATNRVLMSDSDGLYSATLADGNWVLFDGADQPASFADAIDNSLVTVNSSAQYVDTIVDFPYATEQTIYAYPTNQPLSSWATYRVQLTESSGLYTGTLPAAVSSSWAIFLETMQPGTWDEAIGVAILPQEIGSADPEGFIGTVERETTDQTAIEFPWPTSGATITGSLGDGTALTGAITFDSTEESGYHYYQIAYNAADRPATPGVVSYTLTDGTYSRTFDVRIVSPGTGTGGGPVGPGATQVDDIVVTVDGTPEAGVGVWVTTDIEGDNVIAGTLYTDAFGKPDPYFLLDPGTYYLWMQKAGATFANPQTLVVE